ncbi:hypothetical protein QYE76_026019 [Lolium multiflorum]|uniref:Uncharacterized protein n=1 Tax=Lolium multiflorum TaxID=4521 RepID=A0AAD8RHW1_LOLMU|nr:hypothetical protein QYE76_026019 [Lolium multiflorum]
MGREVLVVRPMDRRRPRSRVEGGGHGLGAAVRKRGTSSADAPEANGGCGGGCSCESSSRGGRSGSVDFERKVNRGLGRGKDLVDVLIQLPHVPLGTIVRAMILAMCFRFFQSQPDPILICIGSSK